MRAGPVVLECRHAGQGMLGRTEVGCARIEIRHAPWEPALPVLPDPDTLDISAPLLVNGTLTPGFNWITAFTAGVEMLGLHNWGMPCRDPVTGKILSLHGEAAVIPVDRVAVRSAPIMTIPGVEMTASFIVRAPLFDRSRSASPWHQQGEPVYRVTRAVTLRPSRQEVSIRDRVTNLTARTAIPDWGYHVQLRPEPGARYLVPSQEVRVRFGGAVPAGHQAWHPAAVSRRREERGYAHRRLATRRGRICTLLRYPDGEWHGGHPSPFRFPDVVVLRRGRGERRVHDSS